jgi:pimeloyl-ACP methyl ester carboxylesterase
MTTPSTKTVLFLHGIGTTSGMWKDQVQQLTEFNCVAPDLPGHGTATGRPWVSLEATTAEVIALIEATPEKRAHVVGLSLGGAVAIELMSTRPDLVDRAIVDGAAGISWRLAPLLVGGIALISPLLHTRPFMRLLAHVLSVGSPRRKGFYAEIRLVDSGSFRHAVRDALAARLRNAAAIRGPVLLVAAQYDVGAARVSNATLARDLRDASAWYVPRLWHAWVGTNPELHRAMVRAFLTGGPLPGGLEPETTKPRRSRIPR